MIRIIDETPSPEVVKQILCRNCGVRLEYVPSDIKSIHGTDYGSGPDGEEWIVCPKCNKHVTIRRW